jgi:hypothetical protein
VNVEETATRAREDSGLDKFGHDISERYPTTLDIELEGA